MLPAVQQELAQFYRATSMKRLTTAEAMQRFCSPLEENFNIALEHNMVDGLEGIGRAKVGKSAYSNRSDGYYAGRMTRRATVNASQRLPRYPGSDMYADIGGKLPVANQEGHVYFNMFKDAYTSFRCVYGMKTKDESLTAWQSCIADLRLRLPPNDQLDTLANHPRTIHCLANPALLDPECLITDSDTCYLAGQLRAYNTEHTISSWAIAPYTHDGNPAESEMRRLMEAAIAILFDSGLPPSFLLYAIHQVVAASNRMFTSQCCHPDHKFKSPPGAHVPAQGPHL